MALTPEQVQLLKRELIRIQLNVEAAKIDNLERIDLLGPPFSADGTKEGSSDDLPLLSFAFSNFIATFPLFKKADGRFWTQVCQPFIEGLAARDISSSADRDQATKRRRAARGIRRLILMCYVAGISSESSNVVIDGTKRTPRSAPRRAGEGVHGALASEHQPISFDTSRAEVDEDELRLKQELFGIHATVIGVREISATGIFGSSRTEFIIESQVNGGSPVWVARTFNDFTKLEKTLRQTLKGKQLPSVPLKNNTNVYVAAGTSRKVLLRERQRTTLRYYLYKLCMLPRVAQNQDFLEFLSKSRIQKLSPEEIDDIETRIKLDKQRWEDRNKFVEIASERSANLERYLVDIKAAILQENALPQLFLEMKEHSRVEEMSPLLQKLVEYCLVEVAALLYQSLVARDDSPEIFAQIKRLHRLLPYSIMQGILKLSNPALVMKKLTDLFLVAPFGGRSLLQSMFLHALEDDMKNLITIVHELESQIDDEMLSKAISDFAWSDHEAREQLHAKVELNESDIVLEIVKSAKIGQTTIDNIEACFLAWKSAVSGETSAAAQDKVDYYSLLKDYHKACVRHRDKEVMHNFWGERTTLTFVKAMIDMMYDILIEIFRAPGISDSLGDLKRFVTDLITLVEQLDAGVELDANQMVNEFIALCRRHQNSIFRFINRVYARDAGFFVDIVRWITRFVNFIKAGKEGRNYLDLRAVIQEVESTPGGNFSQDALQQNLEMLQEWLTRRKQTASQNYNFDGYRESAGGPGRLDVSDVGLTWDDIDYAMAEVELDEQIEFGQNAPEDLGQDAVTQERLRQQELKKHRKRQQELDGRPSSGLIVELLPKFQSALIATLRQADVHPSSLLRANQPL